MHRVRVYFAAYCKSTVGIIDKDSLVATWDVAILRSVFILQLLSCVDW